MRDRPLRGSAFPEPVEEDPDERTLADHRVGARAPGRSVEGGVVVAGEGDQAQVGVVLAQTSDRLDAVEQRHVQVDYGCVGHEAGRERDRLDSVGSGSDDAQLGLSLDEGTQRDEESLVVVGEQDVDPLVIHVWRG
jgi:hypothetical protein